jgi:PDZ domain-containing secreted protein
MKKYIFAAVAALGICFSAMALQAAEEGSWTGALIDNHCGAKKDEAAALKHPTSCALKDTCAASGFQLVVGDKHYKLDDKGNEEAKAYLEKVSDKDAGAKVTIAGKVEGDKIDVSSIKDAK